MAGADAGLAGILPSGLTAVPIFRFNIAEKWHMVAHRPLAPPVVREPMSCKQQTVPMDQNFHLSAMFMLGIFGTGHCIGMCGPLVVAFPGRARHFSAHLFYHTGRVATYTLVGGIMGGVGTVVTQIATAAGADPMSWMAGIQAAFSVIAAGALIVFGLSRLGLIREPAWMAIAAPEKIPGYRRTVIPVLSGRSEGRMLAVGFFMGLLPCGLSFAAFARALSAGGPMQGGLLVLAFGLGTLPGLLLVGAGASRVFQKFRRYSDPLSGMLMIGMAASLMADVIGAVAG